MATAINGSQQTKFTPFLKEIDQLRKFVTEIIVFLGVKIPIEGNFKSQTTLQIKKLGPYIISISFCSKVWFDLTRGCALSFSTCPFLH